MCFHPSIFFLSNFVIININGAQCFFPPVLTIIIRLLVVCRHRFSRILQNGFSYQAIFFRSICKLLFIWHFIFCFNHRLSFSINANTLCFIRIPVFRFAPCGIYAYIYVFLLPLFYFSVTLFKLNNIDNLGNVCCTKHTSVFPIGSICFFIVLKPSRIAHQRHDCYVNSFEIYNSVYKYSVLCIHYCPVQLKQCVKWFTCDRQLNALPVGVINVMRSSSFPWQGVCEINMLMMMKIIILHYYYDVVQLL